MPDDKPAARPVGRPPVEIDEDELQKLAQWGATHFEMASYFGVTERTIQNKLKQERYQQAVARGVAKGNMSLRRKQMELALKGDRTMLIWLGKQRLGQKEKVDHTNDGSLLRPKRPKVYVNFVSPDASKAA